MATGQQKIRKRPTRTRPVASSARDGHTPRSVVTAPVEVQRPAGGAATPHLSTLQSDTLRDRLLAGMAEHVSQFQHHAAALADLTANSSNDTTDGRDRAMAVLHAYRAREAIEEIEAALVRIENGSCGSCQSCRLPIAFERLEAMPQVLFCAPCAASAGMSAASPADMPARSRSGQGCERAGALPPPSVRPPQHLQQAASPKTEKPHGNSTAG